MKWFQVCKEAASNVARNKLRTALTMLGLIIGISSVIILVGMSDGSNREVSERMKALGGDVISAFLYDSSISFDDLNELRALPGVGSAAPSKYVEATVSASDQQSKKAMVEGADEHYLKTRNLELSSGRNLSSVDRANRSKVCLLGADVARELFNTTDAVGRVIKLSGDEFTVVGVVESKGESMGLNTGGLVIIPLQTAYGLGVDSKIDSFYVRATDENEVQLAKASISGYLENEKQIPASRFSVNTQDEMLNASGSIDETMTLLLGGIASISLIVAGIGVMNVMLVSVTERIREIGIKKALGARRSDIMLQFLIEALLISLFGGVLGIALGVFACYAATLSGIACVVSPTMVGVAVGASTIIGLVFGIFPAYRASMLNPIDALRQE